MNNETAIYRFDDSYDTAYKWNGEAYICIGNYTRFGIKSSMSENLKTKIVDDFLDGIIDDD